MSRSAARLLTLSTPARSSRSRPTPPWSAFAAGPGGLTKTGAGTLDLNGTTQGYNSLAATGGTTNVNGTLGFAPMGSAVVSVSGSGTKLRFGSVSQTLNSLTIGAGSTVVFTSGAASGSFSGGGDKTAGFGSAASSFGPGASGSTVPEPGTLGLLLVGALGVLNRRRRSCSRVNDPGGRAASLRPATTSKSWRCAYQWPAAGDMIHLLFGCRIVTV